MINPDMKRMGLIELLFGLCPNWLWEVWQGIGTSLGKLRLDKKPHRGAPWGSGSNELRTWPRVHRGTCQDASDLECTEESLPTDLARGCV